MPLISLSLSLAVRALKPLRTSLDANSLFVSSPWMWAVLMLILPLLTVGGKKGTGYFLRKNDEIIIKK
jgi:hypothetical protein